MTVTVVLAPCSTVPLEGEVETVKSNGCGVGVGDGVGVGVGPGRRREWGHFSLCEGHAVKLQATQKPMIGSLKVPVKKFTNPQNLAHHAEQ